jgi:hypothetical protein
VLVDATDREIFRLAPCNGLFLEKMANHVTSGGVTFEVSSRKFFYCRYVTHWHKTFIELRPCGCIVNMRRNCISCCLLRRTDQILIHRTSLFSFIFCSAPPLSWNFFFSRVWLGIIVGASPVRLVTEAIFGDFAVSHLCFGDFLDSVTYI